MDAIPQVVVFFGNGSQVKGRISGYLEHDLGLHITPDTRKTQILLTNEPADYFAAQILSDNVLKRTVSGVRMCDEICGNLGDIISFLPKADPSRVYRLVASSLIAKELLVMLDEFHFHPTQFTHILFVTPYQAENPDPVRYLVGMREATEFWKNQFNREDEKHKHVCGAYFKLNEAIARFGIDVTGKKCIDIGAAPGGWSECLINHGASAVTAVDPAALQYEHPNVTHKRKMIQDCYFEELFDLVVCDMNAYRRDLVPEMAERCAELLKEGGDMILTLKGKKRGWERRSVLTKREKDILSPLFKELRILALIANKKFECTLYCRSRLNWP